MEIGDWIARDNPRRALSFVDELEAACDALAELPARWPLVERHHRRRIRKRAFGGYLIFFRTDRRGVTILRILHGARDYGPILFPDD